MKKSVEKNNLKVKRHALMLCIKIAVICLIFIILFGVIFGLKRIKGIEMYPNIKQGDLILDYRLGHNYDDGDAVIVRKDGHDYVMRIVASAGETVRINDGKIMVNNLVEVKEAFYKTKEVVNSDVTYPYTVKKGHYFVAFDYRERENDSRTFGAISSKEIKGKVISRLQIRNV